MSLLSGLKALMGGEADRGKSFVHQGGDRAVLDASAEARATLPSFWARFEAKDREACLIKVRMALENDRAEHLWMAPVAVAENGFITAVLVNEPLDVPKIRQGSYVAVAPGQISDWSYWNDETLYGNFTTRVFLSSATSDEQAYLRAVLSETPVESV